MWDFETGPFTDAEKSALRLADVLSNAQPEGRVDEALLSEMRASFTDGEIMHIALCCAIITGVAKMANAFGITEQDSAMCAIPLKE